MVGGHHYVAASKAALGMMGREVGAPRPPRLPSTPEYQAQIRQVLEDLDLIPVPVT
jgi:4-hydroxy-tetrahydrodipicolinate synthase